VNAGRDSGSRLRVWLQAARPLSQINIALPLLVGQALAFSTCGHFSWSRFLLVHAFGVLDQLFIVFANDCADWQSDLENVTYNRYSGGSRVIVEGKLSPQTLFRASLGMALLMAGLSAYLTLGLHLMWMLLLCAASVMLLWAYSFPPIRLSYRGKGELLQGLGLGVVLPAIGFYVQCGELGRFPAAAFIPLFLLGYAGNLTTCLPDVPSDRASGKRTYAVRRGQLSARRDSLIPIAIAACMAPLFARGASAFALGALIGLPLVLLCVNARGALHADAKNPPACLRFVTLNAAAIVIAQLCWAVALIF